jgi:hypothetical protein
VHSSIAHAQGQARTLASQCRATLAAADQRGLCCQAGAIEPRGEDTSSGNHGSAYLERVLPGLVDGAHHGRTAQASRRALLGTVRHAADPQQLAGGSELHTSPCRCAKLSPPQFLPCFTTSSICNGGATHRAVQARLAVEMLATNANCNVTL